MGPADEIESAVNDIYHRLITGRARQVALAVQQHGDLRKALLATFPRLLQPALDNGERWDIKQAAALWQDWLTAEARLVECANCRGRFGITSSGRPQEADCQRPVLAPDGAIGWQSCERAHQAFLRQQGIWLLGETALPARFKRRTLANFKATDRQQILAKRAAARFIADFGKPECRGVALLGPAGTGKTHIAAGILIELVGKGVAGRYYPVPDLIGMLRESIGQGHLEDRIAGLGAIPLLVLDDLGKEYLPGGNNDPDGYAVNAWAHQELYRIINRRYENDLPLVLTTNLNEAALTERYGAAITSRLHEMCEWVTLNVADQRREEKG